MADTQDKIERLQQQLDMARLERDAWKKNKCGQHHFEVASILVRSFEQAIADEIKKQKESI